MATKPKMTAVEAKARHTEWCRLRKKGKSYREIAAQFGVTSSAVHWAVAIKPHDPRCRGTKTGRAQRIIGPMIWEGRSDREIADRIGSDPGTIWHFRKRHGFPRAKEVKQLVAAAKEET